MGSGTYGIAAASNKYFKKSLNELNIPEIAFLAGLQKHLVDIIQIRIIN